MFSLIISVMAIVLTVALAAVTFYYGGNAMNDGRKQADSAALINQSQQISAAIDLYMADNPGESISDLSSLAPQYMAAIPNGWDFSSSVLPTVPGYAAFPISGNDEGAKSTCEDVNMKLGLGANIPACSSISSNFTGCCSN